jgi:predicted ATPase
MGGSSPRLLDRDGELATLAAVLTSACRGRGGIVLLEGAAGVGKTALMGATASLARERGMQIFSAQGGELEQEYPFGLIRQLYEPLLAAAEPDRRQRLWKERLALRLSSSEPAMASRPSTPPASVPCGRSTGSPPISPRRVRWC